LISILKGFCDMFLKYYMCFSLPMLKHLPPHAHTKDELALKEVKKEQIISLSTGNKKLAQLL